MKKQIQIFKPGKHTAMSGAALSFSESDLKASAAAYDPSKHEAPIVVGHPTHDAPAYGWVKSLAFADGLEAEHQQVDPAFAEMVDRGAFKKISASFYTPDSPSNPVPGVYYLRHVGFLGAQPPAVKGLRSPEFAETEQGVIEFADYDDMQNASLWRGLREWIISKFGLDEADKVIPNYAVSQLEQSAQAEDDSGPDTDTGLLAANFSEKPNQGDEMSAEEKARLAALETENAKLKVDAANFAEAQAKAKLDARHTEHLAFAEGLIKQGKLLPTQKDVTVATLDFMAGHDTVIQFGEGDAKQPLLDAHKAMLQALPKQVEFKEVAAGNPAIHDAEPDPSRIAADAIAFQESEAAAGRVVNAAQAVDHVKKVLGIEKS